MPQHEEKGVNIWVFGFIDLITALEKEAGKELDLDAALDRPDATTIGGLKTLFQ